MSDTLPKFYYNPGPYAWRVSTGERLSMALTGHEFEADPEGDFSNSVRCARCGLKALRVGEENVALVHGDTRVPCK